MNILIVEDEPLVAVSIKNIFKNLAVVNYVDTALNFHEGYNKSVSGVFDVILIDIFLGDRRYNGIDLIRSIRKSNPHVPIIVLTAFHSIAYLEGAFGAGANDYITKPFHPRELELRVKRWFYTFNSIVSEKILYNELSYNFDQHEFYFHDTHLPLTRRNKSLLLLFLQHPETLLRQEYICEKFWGDYEIGRKNRNVRSNIQSLRDALSDSCAEWLHTIHGEGYILQKKRY